MMSLLTLKKRFNTIIVLVLLSILGLLAFIPLYWMVTTALTEPSLTLKFPPEFIPKKIVFTNSFSNRFYPFNIQS